MLALSYYLSEIHKNFDQLIIGAENLVFLTLYGFAEKEIASYQLQQKKILTQIEELNQVIEANFKNQLDESDQQQLHHKIRIFQELNKEFIQNLKKNHGLIEFELAHSHSQHEEEI